MDIRTYLAHVEERLAEQGFAGLAAPAEMISRLPLVMQREEEWGRLMLALTAPDLHDDDDRERLAAAAGAWVRNLTAAAGGAPRHLILVFPFSRRVGEELAAAVQRLAASGDNWSVLPWSADLEVGLADQHRGFPRLGAGVARAVAEAPRGAAGDAWQALARPRERGGPVRRRAAWMRWDLGYVPATRLILAATVGLYVAQVLFENGGLLWTLTGGTLPDLDLTRLLANHGRQVITLGEHYRLLTYIFLHGGVLHLAMNMWALWSVGPHVEMLFGTLRTAFIYAVAGVAGGLASTVLRPGAVYSVGASGAIMGLMGALVYFAVAFPGRAVDWRALVAPVGINLFFGVLMGGLVRIDNYGHFGGFIGGLLAAFLAGVAGQRRAAWRPVAMGAMTLLLLAILANLFPLPHWPLFR